MKTIYFLLCLLLIGNGVFAATNTAPSLHQVAVQTALNACSPGDTLLLPAGSTNWNVNSVSNNMANITVAGAGTNATFITIDKDNTTGQYDLGGGLYFGGGGYNQVSGITFIGHGTSYYGRGCVVMVSGAPGGVLRVHDCAFNKVSLGVKTVGNFGVVDHCSFTNCANGVQSFGVGDGMYNWNTYYPIAFASTNYFFVEDNKYSCDDTTDYYQPVGMSSDQGASIVFRNNTIRLNATGLHTTQLQPMVDFHGDQTGTRGVLSAQVYGNRVDSFGVPPLYVGRITADRSGQSLNYSNTFNGTYFDRGFVIEEDSATGSVVGGVTYYDNITNTWQWANITNGVPGITFFCDPCYASGPAKTDYHDAPYTTNSYAQPYPHPLIGGGGGPPPPTYYTLSLQSVNPLAGVTLTTSPPDKNGQSSGVTAFALSYLAGTNVTVTAPATVAGNNFSKWQLDGVDSGTSLSTSLVMTNNRTVIAVYAVTNPPPVPAPTSLQVFNATLSNVTITPQAPGLFMAPEPAPSHGPVVMEKPEAPQPFVVPQASSAPMQYTQYTTNKSGQVFTQGVTYNTGGGLAITANGLIATTNVANGALNILTFGADWTGTTNADTAIAAAIANLGTKGGEIFFPPGRYRIASPITLTNAAEVTLRGFSSVGNLNTNTASAIVLADNANCDMLIKTMTGRVNVRDLLFDGNKSHQTSTNLHGFWLQGTNSVIQRCSISDVIILNVAGTGIQNDNRESRFYRVGVSYCLGDGVFNTASSDVTLEDVLCGFNGNAGYHAELANSFRVTRGDFYCNKFGAYLKSCCNNFFEAVTFDANERDGVWVDSVSPVYSYRNYFHHCSFNDNNFYLDHNSNPTPNPSGTYSNFKLTGMLTLETDVTDSQLWNYEDQISATKPKMLFEDARDYWVTNNLHGYSVNLQGSSFMSSTNFAVLGPYHTNVMHNAAGTWWLDRGQIHADNDHWLYTTMQDVSVSDQLQANTWQYNAIYTNAAWKYVNNGPAFLILPSEAGSSNIAFYAAPSSTAGSSITWQPYLRGNSSGTPQLPSSLLFTAYATGSTANAILSPLVGGGLSLGTGFNIASGTGSANYVFNPSAASFTADLTVPNLIANSSISAPVITLNGDSRSAWPSGGGGTGTNHINGNFMVDLATQTGSLQVTNNATIGGNMTVNGQILTTNNLNGWLNVRAFGAVGNGTNDDTTAIQSAINTLRYITGPFGSATNGTVYFPAGIYKITTPIQWPWGVSFVGDGRGASIVSNATTTLDSFQLVGNTNAFTQPFSMANMGIRGSQSASAGVGVRIAYTIVNNGPWPSMENVAIIGHQYCVYMNTPVFGKFINCQFHGATSDGVRGINACNVVTFENCWFYGNKGNGANFDRFDSSKFIACSFQGNTNYGLTITRSWANHIDTCDAEANGNTGIVLQDTFASTITSLSTYVNTNGDLSIKGGQGVTMNGLNLSNWQGNAPAIHIEDSPTIYGAAAGIVINGDVISTSNTNALAVACDHPEKVSQWNRRSFNGNAYTVWGNKSFMNDSSGELTLGGTNQIGIPSVSVLHDFGRVRLRATTDSSFMTELINNYDFTKAFQLLSYPNGTNEVLRWDPSNGRFSVFPAVPNQIVLNDSVSIGTTTNAGHGSLLVTNTVAASNVVAAASMTLNGSTITSWPNGGGGGTNLDNLTVTNQTRLNGGVAGDYTQPGLSMTNNRSITWCAANGLISGSSYGGVYLDANNNLRLFTGGATNRGINIDNSGAATIYSGGVVNSGLIVNGNLTNNGAFTSSGITKLTTFTSPVILTTVGSGGQVSQINARNPNEFVMGDGNSYLTNGVLGVIGGQPTNAILTAFVNSGGVASSTTNLDNLTVTNATALKGGVTVNNGLTVGTGTTTLGGTAVIVNVPLKLNNLSPANRLLQTFNSDGSVTVVSPGSGNANQNIALVDGTTILTNGFLGTIGGQPTNAALTAIAAGTKNIVTTQFMPVPIFPTATPGSGTQAYTVTSTSDTKLQFGTNYVAQWPLLMPSTYASNLVFKAMGNMETGTSVNMQLQVSIWKISATDAVNMGTESFDTSNNSTVTSPGSARFPFAFSIPLNNNDGIVAGDWFELRVVSAQPAGAGFYNLSAANLEWAAK